MLLGLAVCEILFFLNAKMSYIPETIKHLFVNESKTRSLARKKMSHFPLSRSGLFFVKASDSKRVKALKVKLWER